MPHRIAGINEIQQGKPNRRGKADECGLLLKHDIPGDNNWTFYAKMHHQDGENVRGRSTRTDGDDATIRLFHVQECPHG